MCGNIFIIMLESTEGIWVMNVLLKKAKVKSIQNTFFVSFHDNHYIFGIVRRDEGIIKSMDPDDTLPTKEEIEPHF